jgi:exodeoxyribonuclease-5
MTLTKGQEQGLKIAVERYRRREPYTVIAGVAGAGKSTLVQFIIDALKLREEDVVYIAYTGRASLVLRNKGCANAITAHKLLYRSKEKPDGTYQFIPKAFLDYKYKMIVLDEASMLPEEMWQLLLSHKIHVLALGDAEQLPPVQGNSTILNAPHVVLHEVVRQALDSPIIRLSVDIREGKWIEYGGPKECRVMSEEQVSDKLLAGADQVLCGKNITRHCLNERMRHIQFGERYVDKPLNGDKVICLKNEWSVLGSNDEPLVNGMIGTINNVSLHDGKFYKPEMIADFKSDNDGLYRRLQMDYKIFTEKETTVNKDNWMQFPKNIRAYEFDYGYAVTVHKFQGSEAEKVVVYDEWLGDRDFHRKWLYTAVTRASKMLVVVK